MPSTQSASARALALEALSRVQHGSFLAPTLDTLLSSANLEREDRALVTDLGYGTVRRLIQLDAALAPLLERPERLPPNVLNALRLGAYELLYRNTPAYAAVSAWVDVVRAGSPRLSGLVNAVLRRVQAPDASADPALAASLPQWLFASFEASLGEHAPAAAAAMLEAEPLWLTALAPGAEAALVEDGAEVTGGGVGEPHGPRALRVRAPVPVARLRAFQRGLIQPQNPSSLAVALALGAGEGDRVLDLASGRGVKSAVLAALGADVTALELDAKRNAAARANLRRLGLEVSHLVTDLRRPPPLAPAPFVLLDAPCTGTGTLRGHPEIKLRLRPDDVLAAAALQLELLTAAAALTAPGGSLLYAVCSLTPEEGPGVVERFLAGAPDFAPAELDALPLESTRGGPGRYLLPYGGADGFFVARLTRRAAGAPTGNL